MPTRLIASATAVLEKLAASPRLLFAVAVAANAVFLPYLGLTHDAVLYAGQVLHSADGRFADDLFFRFDNQNRYTLLPLSLAGFAQTFGVEPVFFAAYLLSNAVRLAASQALVFRVFGRSPATAAGVLLIAVADVPTGCSAVFRVNEPFFTARVPALAVSILGLERALAGRAFTAGLCLLLGLAAHPLMALPAVAVAGAWGLGNWASTPRRRAVLGVLALPAAAVAGWYLERTAGTLDPEWRMLMLAQNAYLDPARWKPWDLLRLVVVGAAVVAAAKATADGATRRFLWVTVAAAGAGYLVSVAACRGSWAILVQGQAYRAVWPLELLGYPAGMLAVARLWGDPAGRAKAVALFAALLAAKDLFAVAAVVLLAAAVAVGWVVAAARAKPGGPWLATGLAAGLGVWAVAWYGVWLPVRFAPLFAPPVSDSVGWADRLEPVFYACGPLPRFALALAGAAGLLRVASPPRLAGGIALAAGFGVSAAVFAVPRTEGFAARFDPGRADYRFVRGYLDANRAGPRTPTVYWPFGRLEGVWVDVGANAFVSSHAMTGVTFSREFADEGYRRLRLVLPFQQDAIRRQFGPHAHLFSRGEDVSGIATFPPPTADEFRELVADPGLDYLVLPQDFGGSAATNGRVWVYDCQQLRAAK